MIVRHYIYIIEIIYIYYMTLIHHIILDHSVLIAANWCELQVRVAPPSAFHTWAATVAVAEFVALVAPSRRTVHHTGSRDDRDDPLGDLLMTLVFKHQPGDVHIWKLWKGWGKNMLNKKTVCFPEEALGLQNGNDACQETVDRPNMWTGSAAPQISMAYGEIVIQWRLSTFLSWELPWGPWPERMKRHIEWLQTAAVFSAVIYSRVAVVARSVSFTSCEIPASCKTLGMLGFGSLSTRRGNYGNSCLQEQRAQFHKHPSFLA